MNQSDFLADILTRDIGMLQATLADFSDADMLVRPVPTANHTAWQLGHLATAECSMVNAAKPGAGGELPAGFAAKFTKETCTSDDPKLFPTKAQLLEVLSKVRASTVAYARTLTPADMDQKMPEPMQQFVPTVAHLVTMMPVHLAMHLGQFQVIRRKLGKPILF